MVMLQIWHSLAIQCILKTMLHSCVCSHLEVETIGDAYMVVGGVPERRPDHAAAVADMGLDMVIRAREVVSPATGKPLQVRQLLQGIQ